MALHPVLIKIPLSFLVLYRFWVINEIMSYEKMAKLNLLILGVHGQMLYHRILSQQFLASFRLKDLSFMNDLISNF